MAQIDKRWAMDPQVAAYTWEATRDGLTIAVEYPPGDAPETPFSQIGFRYRARTGKQQDDVHTFVNDTPNTVRFRARPLRDEATFPNLEIDVAPGDAVVWTHRVVQTFAIMGVPSSAIRFESMVFGRETAAGKIDLSQIWPNGEVAGYGTYADAMNAL